VSNVGSSSDIATRVMLRKIGLDPENDVTIVPVGSLQNRTAALLNGAIDAGVAQPPEQLALEDKGLHILYDLAAEKLPAATDTIVVQRSWLNGHRDVAQKYIDSLVEAIALNHKDKEKAISVLQKYLNTDDQRALETTYDFFVNNVTPAYPMPRVDLFKDSVDQLSASNDKVKDFDISKVLDTSFVQSAMDRKLGG
jgi:NitT/TauT family transport system substrate-binding protein